MAAQNQRGRMGNRRTEVWEITEESRVTDCIHIDHRSVRYSRRPPCGAHQLFKIIPEHRVEAAVREVVERVVQLRRTLFGLEASRIV